MGPQMHVLTRMAAHCELQLKLRIRDYLKQKVLQYTSYKYFSYKHYPYLRSEKIEMLLS